MIQRLSCWVSKATRAHVHANSPVYPHTHTEICTTYYSSTAKAVSWTRLSVTVCVHRLFRANRPTQPPVKRALRINPRKYNGWSVKLTTQIHLAVRLRMSGVMTHWPTCLNAVVHLLCSRIWLEWFYNKRCVYVYEIRRVQPLGFPTRLL